MNPCEEQLFSYSDIATVAPWLTPEACQELARAGLFSPRMLLAKLNPTPLT